MSAHTPGPWVVSHMPLNPNPRVLAGKKVVVVVNRGPHFHAEVEENACLIAAAPDLLEALERCTTCLANDEEPDNFEQMLAAIRKARGQ